MSKETVTLIAAVLSLLGSIVVVFLGMTLALKKERRQLRWSKELDRLFALEELAGVLTSELSGYRAVVPETLIPKLEELNIAAGRFSRHDELRRAILTLHNTLSRMLVAKASHADEVETMRAELVTHLADLLRRCDEVAEGASISNWLEKGN